MLTPGLKPGPPLAAIGTALDVLPGGVQRRPVALLADRGAAAVHAMLGTLAAGGFYIVLDPAQGESRLRDILSQVAPAALLADAAHMAQGESSGRFGAGAGPGGCACGRTAAGAAWPPCRRQPWIRTLPICSSLRVQPGRPKGVAVTHRNLLAYSEWVVNTLRLRARHGAGEPDPAVLFHVGDRPVRAPCEAAPACRSCPNGCSASRYSCSTT